MKPKRFYRIHYKNESGATLTGWQKAPSKSLAHKSFLEENSTAVSIKGIYRVHSSIYAT